MLHRDDDPLAPLPRPAAHVVGEDLSAVSLKDLDERVELLKAEIARVEAARDARRKLQDAADAVFGRRSA